MRNLGLNFLRNPVVGMGTASRCVAMFQDQAQTYAQPVFPFGELVLVRRPGAHLQESQTQFVYGCWLGRDSQTDEHIVGD